MKFIFKKPLHTLIILLIIGFIQIEVSAQSQTNNQSESNYDTLKDVSYGSDAEQNMDIYLSNVKTQNYTVVFLHGGGYYFSDKSKEERYIQPYLERGFNVVNLNYRLKRGIPIATEDLTIALNFLKSKNAEYPLNLDQIVVTGFSAGAHIATNVGVSQNDKNYPNKLEKGINIVGIVNFSGPVDGLDVVEKVFSDNEMEVMQTIGKALFPETEDYAPIETISVYEPITYLDKKDPPVFLWHGGLDEQIPPKTFEAFVERLNNDSNKNVVIFDPEAGHSPSNESLAVSYKKIFDFIDGL
ncbi:MAG: alpha/beta hydrolase fold domain-containing protein [Bacteroidota bacterium]